MKFNLKHIQLFTLIVLCFTLISAHGAVVYAADLSSAKANGYVGETSNGYIAIVQPNVPGDISALVESVNSKRRAKYNAIANRNGQPLNVIESLAGRKLIEMTPPGQYIQTPSGSWQKK